jgi:hypothetical protein
MSEARVRVALSRLAEAAERLIAATDAVEAFEGGAAGASRGALRREAVAEARFVRRQRALCDAAREVFREEAQ